MEIKNVCYMFIKIRSLFISTVLQLVHIPAKNCVSAYCQYTEPSDCKSLFIRGPANTFLEEIKKCWY
jgi:hypothetical protein